VIGILLISFTGSYASRSNIPELERTFKYELSLENISEDTSYELFVPTIFERDEVEIDLVLHEQHLTGDASITHKNTTQVMLLKIDGTGPISIDFSYDSNTNRYELSKPEGRYNRSSKFNEEYPIYFNCTFDCEPELYLYFKDYYVYYEVDFYVEDTLKKEGWQYVDGSHTVLAIK